MKKRYQVTLTEDTVTRFQMLREKLNLPSSAMSAMLDDSLKSCVDNMEKWVKNGKVSMVDLFAAIGESLDQLADDKSNKKGNGNKALTATVAEVQQSTKENKRRAKI
jgi:hypothetical protein